MESILETKADTILEFIQGLQGSLSVTFEEGISAAWLPDLLKPHVTHLVVCDPRKNALLKEGSRVTESMRESWRSCAWQPAHVGLPRRARDAHLKGIRSQLRNHYEGSRPGHESNQSTLPKLGHSLQRYQRLCTAASRRMVRQDPGPRSSSAGRTTLSATGSAAAGASASATRFARSLPPFSARAVPAP